MVNKWQALFSRTTDERICRIRIAVYEEVSWPRLICFHSVSPVNSVSHINMKARLLITITTISIEMDKLIGTSRHNHRLFKYPIKVLGGLKGKASKNVTFLVSWI